MQWPGGALPIFIKMGSFLNVWMCKVLLYSILLVFLNLLLNGFWKSPLSLLLTTTRGCTCLRLVLCLSRWPHTEVVSQLTSVSRFSSVAHNFSFCKPESPDDFFYSFAALWTGLKGRESNISVQCLQCYRSCSQTRFQRFNFYTLVLSHVDTTSQVPPPIVMHLIAVTTSVLYR